jgi:hypothetical protein
VIDIHRVGEGFNDPAVDFIEKNTMGTAADPGFSRRISPVNGKDRATSVAARAGMASAVTNTTPTVIMSRFLNMPIGRGEVQGGA